MHTIRIHFSKKTVHFPKNFIIKECNYRCNIEGDILTSHAIHAPFLHPEIFLDARFYTLCFYRAFDAYAIRVGEASGEKEAARKANHYKIAIRAHGNKKSFYVL